MALYVKGVCSGGYIIASTENRDKISLVNEIQLAERLMHGANVNGAYLNGRSLMVEVVGYWETLIEQYRAPLAVNVVVSKNLPTRQAIYCGKRNDVFIFYDDNILNKTFTMSKDFLRRHENEVYLDFVNVMSEKHIRLLTKLTTNRD